MEDSGMDGSGRSGGTGGRSSKSRRPSAITSSDSLDLSKHSKSSNSRSKQHPNNERRPSSIGSSSAASHRRAKEKASQVQKKEVAKNNNQRRGSREYNSHHNDYMDDSERSEQRIPTIMEVGGGDFVEELRPGGYNTTNINNLNSGMRYNNPQQQQQRRNTAPTTATNNNNNNHKAVVHACDDKGRCIFHPHIQLRKKAIMGVIGGWKDIRRFCPDCERQEFMQELITREANEIKQMERILDQMEQLDAEYLNDDTDHGYNHHNEDGGGGLEPEGEMSRRSSQDSKERNPARVVIEGPVVIPQRRQSQQQPSSQQPQQQQQQFRRRSSRELQKQHQQLQAMQLQSAAKEAASSQQQKVRRRRTLSKERNEQPRRRRTLSKERNDNNNVDIGQPRRRRTLSKERKDDSAGRGQPRRRRTLSKERDEQPRRRKTLSKERRRPPSPPPPAFTKRRPPTPPPKFMRKNRNHIVDDDDGSSSYYSSSSSSSSFQRKQVKKKEKKKKWKKMMKKNKKSNNATATTSTRSLPKQRNERRRDNMSNTPPPQRTSSEGGGLRKNLTKEKSIKLMKDVNKSVTKGITGILREGKKRSIELSHSMKKQISTSSLLNGNHDEYDSEESDEHSYYSSASDSSDSSESVPKGGNTLQHRSRSDPVGIHGGIRNPRPAVKGKQSSQKSDPPQKSGGGNAKFLHRQAFVGSSATFTDLKNDKNEILDLHASLTRRPSQSDGIRVFGGRADPIPEDDALQASLENLGYQMNRSEPNERVASRKKDMASDLHDSSANFTDVKQERGEIVDLHASITELPGGFPYSEIYSEDPRSSSERVSSRRKDVDSDLHDSSATFTDVKQERGEIVDLHASITELTGGPGFLARQNSLSVQDLRDSWNSQHKSSESSLNDSSATFTDARHEKGEIVDLHASITELNGGAGYENLRKSLTRGEIDDLRASLTEQTGASYNETMLKQASAAAANQDAFHDSSATFTDHSRDRGEIFDMHASITQLQGPTNLLQRIESDNSSATYTDYESDMDEVQSLHASFTQLRRPTAESSASSSSVDDNASFTDICLNKLRKPDSGTAEEVDAVDDNASFTDICLNMLRKPDSGAAELVGRGGEEEDVDIDDDASFTDICINLLLRKSDSDTTHQRFRAQKRRSLSVDASDDDFDMAFDSDKISYENNSLQVPPKPRRKSRPKKNAARLRAERWEQARKMFSAKIEEERLKGEEMEQPKVFAPEKPRRRVSFSEIVEELRPDVSKPENEMTDEEKTRLRAELWKQARELFSEQIAEEERIAKENFEKQLQGLYEPSSSISFEPKLEEQPSSAVEEQQQMIGANHEATPAAGLPDQVTGESSSRQSSSELISEQVHDSSVADGVSSSIERLESEQTDLTEASEQTETTDISSLDDRFGSNGDQDAFDDTDDLTEQLRDVPKTQVKTFEVTNLPFTGSFGESGMYTGTVNEKYEPTGKGIMMYDNGEELRGHWKNGDFLRESELYSDDEDDDDDSDDDDEEEDEDFNSSMADVGAKRDRSRSRSKSKDRLAAKSPPRPTYSIGDTGKKTDMITDKDAAIALVEKLTFGEGAFIRRSDGNWTYAEVKSFEETPEGRASIRFIVNQKNSSKSYAKKYWKTHIRPLKVAPKKPSASSVERTGRGRNAVDGTNSSDESNRGISCPPVQSRLSFDWPNRSGRSRSRSLRRAVSASPMRTLHSISELAKEEDAGED